MLLLLTFDEPSSGSRTTEKRPWPTRFTSPISSEATWDTSFVFCSAPTNRSFIQTSSSSCCSPYTFLVDAGSRRIGNSFRMRGASPANKSSSFARSRSTFAACSASVTSVPRPSSVFHVPAFEVILEHLLAAVEVPPGPCVRVSEIREGPEVLHALRPDVVHLGFNGFLLERILPDRPAGEESGGAPLAGDLRKTLAHVEA